MRINIHTKLLFSLFLFIDLQIAAGQDLYYPDSVWQTKKPADVNMNARMLDSAISFAIQNETSTDYDLRIADLKAYANEPGYKILGPTKPRGKSAGIILRHGYIVAQWGD